MICFRNATDHVVDSSSTAGDLDIVLLSSTYEITLAEGSTKVGDMVALQVPVVAARP